MNSNRPENYSAEGQDAAQMSCKIYVGNLAWATDENALSSHFASVGEVKGAVVMRSEGRSRGFGFVTFANPEQAKQAIDTMYDSELRMMHEYGRRLRVNVANQLIRGGTGGPGDYPMSSGSAPGGYQYPNAPYPGGSIPYGGYSHPPPPAHGGYMGGGYMNPTSSYPGNETGGYPTGGPTSHPMPDGRKGNNQPGGFYPNGGSYPYPQGGYGY
ncbi:hypothetical protein PGTUg99_005507 [Puccinia graminis f. sp. tritici]|uniref:RRM domain-containing protein n=1 Tax=Puccinia graminis f. sp. tritici TaxID=56615 RepID=A0A5B0MNP0_PUCGR|nr:hypothetical protein PGTUg99_005507 [Puccinia graminis f. sp. tritici]